MVTQTSAVSRVGILCVLISLPGVIQSQIGFGGSSSSASKQQQQQSGIGDNVSFGGSNSNSAATDDDSQIDNTFDSILGEPDLITTRLFTKQAGQRCTDPDGSSGICRVHRRCRKFRRRVLNDLNANNGRVSSSLRSYVNAAVQSPCGFDTNKRQWTVCCATKQTTPTTSRPNPTDQCGSSSRSGNTLRIVNGQEAIPGSFPSVVALGSRSGSSGIRVICGGTLISNQHVLSAAHCNKALPGTRTIARLGEHDLSRTSDGQHQDFTVSRITAHSGYNERSLKNDIMILRLRNRVTFTDRIGTACLPRSGYNPERELRDDPIVIGWGSTSTGGGTVNALREATIDFVGQRKCSNAYSSISRITIGSDQVCAGDGSTDTCTGDSGGPMLTQMSDGRQFVIGVTSFGVECARSDFPGVYTRVDQFLGWIRSNT